MTKKAEQDYFDKIGDDGVLFTLKKPYSDRKSAGCLMHNIAAIMSLISNQFGDQDLRIIDVGCGSGWTTNQFAMMGHRLLGVDIADGAIKAAKKMFKLPNLSYETLDYDMLASKHKAKFNVAIFHDSLHHSDDPTRTLNSVRATLKEGGVCVVCEPGKGHSKSPDAVDAVERYGVTEADMPSNKVIRHALEAGFSGYKVYASPSLMHRVLYWEYIGKYSVLRFGMIRLLFVVATYLLKKHKEGIVVLYK